MTAQRRNILLLMADQLPGKFLRDRPADGLRARDLKRLGTRSVRFPNASVASPLCAPGRAAVITGKLASRAGVNMKTGDMPCERGLCYKMSFREGAARVPLMPTAPRLAPGRAGHPVLTLGLRPDVCALPGVSLAEVARWTQGEKPLARGAGSFGPAAGAGGEGR